MGNHRSRRSLRSGLFPLLLCVFFQVELRAAGFIEENDGANRRKVVVAATDATWPPMEFIDTDGTIVGFDIDLFQEIADRAGFEVEFRNTAWDGIFAGIAAGTYDVIVSSVTLLESRKRTMLFSRPYFLAAQYLIVHERSGSISDITELVGREVGAEIGTTGAWFIRSTPGVHAREYDDLGLAIEDLINGRIGGVVADTAIVEHYVSANPRYGAVLRVAGPPYATEAYAFAVSLDRPELVKQIDTALESILEDGTWVDLYHRWFPVSGGTVKDPASIPAFPPAPAATRD